MSHEKRELFQMPIVEKTFISFNIIIAIGLFKSYRSRKKIGANFLHFRCSFIHSMSADIVLYGCRNIPLFVSLNIYCSCKPIGLCSYLF